VDTSISFVRGPGGDTDIADRIQRFLSCPTVVTSTAVVRACRALGVRQVAVLSVYVDALNATIPRFFEPQGIGIARIAKLNLSMEGGSTSEDMAAIDPGALVAAGRAADGPDIDAIFIPCTAVRTLESIELLEEAIGKPVITAVQATMWAVQRLAGVTADVPQGGRLFATS
jgi:maleate cis-trans isomerase